MANLNAGFPGMAGAAQALQIAQRIRKFGVRSDRLDMIDLQPPPFAALDALPAVAVQRLNPQGFPARTACDLGAMAAVFIAQAAHRVTCSS